MGKNLRSPEAFRALKAEIKLVRTALVLQFPDCFVAKGGTKKPLKIGIMQDILAEGRSVYPGLSRRLLKAFISDYCGGPNYYKAVTKGAVRVDLMGNFAGFVSQEEAAHAAKCLERYASLPARTVDATVDTPADPPLSPLEMKRISLINAEEAQYAASMSDNWYVTSGRKAETDAYIRELKAEIAAMEACEQEVAA